MFEDNSAMNYLLLSILLKGWNKKFYGIYNDNTEDYEYAD